MMHLLDRMNDIARPTRRSFFKLSVGAGAGLALGVYGLGTRSAGAATGTTFNPFVQIGTDGRVTVLCKHLDKGQGTASGLATLVADELDAAHDQIDIAFAPANAELYNNLAFGTVQGTGGSTAIPNSFMQYREAGAAARAMLLEAAAQDWGVDAASLVIKDGEISDGAGNSATFGDFAEAASALPLPEAVQLKTAAEWVYIGKDFPRLDVPIKSSGAAGVYGMDQQLDDMLVAVLAKSPKFGGKVKSYDATEALAVKGVVDVIQIPQGIAVLAESTWPAISARDLVQIDWDFTEAETRSSGAIREAYLELANQEGAEVRHDGDPVAALDDAEQVIESTFSFPFLAHAPMEPVDVTILFDGERAQLWTGSQIQTLDQSIAASVLGIEPTNVEVHTLWAGGSFGRRAIYDSHYAAEAAALAKAWGKAQPIKLVYTREDDIRGGYYRPAYVHKVRAGVDADGNIKGWHHHIVGQSILKGTMFEQALVHNGIDDTSVEGVSDASYAIPDFRVELTTTDVRVPGLWWRSVGHTHTAYVMEAMMDQVAHGAKRDAIEIRRAYLADDARKLGVLDKVAEASNWDAGPAEGRFRGVAVHKSFNSYVAQVAEISLADSGRIKVEKVWCAVDCGIAVNPDNIRAQMEGGIGYGLGAILRNEITLTDGAVDQANFDSYEPLRIDDMPDVEVHIVDSTEPPTGVGEPGTPPIGPAVANAIFAATGQMPVDLPLSRGGLV